MNKYRLAPLFVFVLQAVTLLIFNSCNYVTGEALTTSTPARHYTILYSDVSPSQAHTIIASDSDRSDFMIIDVRTAEEYASGHLPDAINIDYYSPTFKNELSFLDKNSIYLIYCRTGARSTAAGKMMQEMGFATIFNMTGGITAWIA